MSVLSANGYKKPPEKIREIFDRERNPYIDFVDFENFGFEIRYQLHKTLEQLSDPSVKLAGKDVSKRLNAVAKSYPLEKIDLIDFSDNKRISIELPEKAKIRNYKISNDNRKLALLNETGNGVELIISNLETGKCRYFVEFSINDVLKDGIIGWFNDSKHILLKIIPENRFTEPVKSGIPSEPIIEETTGKKSTVRTYQNLLENKYDETLFKYYFTSQIIILDIETGSIEKLNDPAIYDTIELSPDNEYLLVETILEPFSYQVPYYRFPKKFEILDMTGNITKKLHQRPLQDEVPIGGTYTGPRYFRWQPLKNASLIWVEALDEGNPKNDVEQRDRIMRLSAPFAEKPEQIFRLEHRYSHIKWSEQEDELIIAEYDRDKLWRREWFFQIGKDANCVFDMSVKNEYNDPGRLVSRKTRSGRRVFIKENDSVYFINNTGATPEGNFPYLMKYDLSSNGKEILFKCREDKYESISCFADKNLQNIIIKSEDQDTAPNYFSVELETQKRNKLTDYLNNFPELTSIRKELVTYQRKDGILLSGELYLPQDYRDGEKLPLVFNAYPQEFTDASTAGQVKASPNRFIRFSGASIRYFALMGYAVLTRASIPIVGNPETVNENFIEQTISSVKAAIDYLDRRGIIDRQKVGITGHSYGAFMVANVLANSDLCKAGIAKSGAYNRTLTPFGFQSERRTLWEAKDFYTKVSPFMQAEKVKEPILLIHGEDDPNSGTYPLQSKRFYYALKGNGGTARLVILPFEGHSYRARKSSLHVLAEMIEWFDKYVK